jgi:excisionase family DNA binding protein
MQNLLTIREVASRLNVSRSTVYNAIDTGVLPHHRFGRGRGTIRVSEEQLEQFLARAEVERPPTEAMSLREVTYRGPSK